MTRISVVFAAAGVFLSASASEVLYKDDFNVRRSSAPLPGAGLVHTLRYLVDPNSEYTNLGNNFITATTDESYAPSNKRLYPNLHSFYLPNYCQDGWIRSLNAAQGACLLVVENNNPYMLLSHGKSVEEQAHYRSPIYNTVTNGILDVSVDLSVPNEALWKSSSAMYFALGDEVAMSPLFADKEVFYRHFAAQFGIRVNGSDLAFYATDGNEDGSVNGNHISPKQAATKGTWYRFVAHINLDTERCEVAVHSIDTDGNQSATPIDQWSNLKFRTNRQHGFKGVSGILTANYWMTHAGYDNIRLAWRTTANAEPVVFYENDFATRRLRQVSPVPTAEFAYGDIAPRINCVTNQIYSLLAGSWTGADTLGIVKPGDKNKTSVQAPGYGGWRRQNCDSYHEFQVVRHQDMANNDYVLRVSGDAGSFGAMSLLFGDCITSGVVRARADIYAPEIWCTGYQYNAAWFGIGSKTQDDAVHANWGTHRVARAGICGKNDGASTPSGDVYALGDYFFSSGIYGQGLKYESNKWYRVELLVDLDNRTVSNELWQLDRHYSLNEQRDSAATLLKASSGGFWNANVRDISSIILAAYGSAGVSDNVKANILFDNIRITKKTSLTSANETLVYETGFDKSVACVPEKSRPFATFPNSTVDNPDGWYRRNNGVLRFALEEDDAGRRSIRAARDEGPRTYYPVDYGVLVRALGREYRKGTFTIRVDVRPPRYWIPSDYAKFWIGFGDNRAWQGNVFSVSGADTEVYNRYILGQVGFDHRYWNDADDGKYLGRFYELWPYILRGASAADDRAAETVYGNNVGTENRAHWHRIEITTTLESGKFDVKMYDMGAEQPAVDAPNGTQIYESANNLFRRALNPDVHTAVSGFSSILIGVYGPPGHETSAENARLRFTNVVVTQEKNGAIIILR